MGHARAGRLAVKVRSALDRLEPLEQLVQQLTICGITGFEREYRFDPVRRWRIDLAFVTEKLAVEYEGGTWTGSSRHTIGAGYRADCDKYNELSLAGWRLLRITADMVRDISALRLIERALGGK